MGHITPTAKDRCIYTAFLLATTAWSCLALSYTAQDPLPRNGATQSGLGLPTSISDHDHIPQICPQASFVWLIPQFSLCSQMILSCGKVTFETKHSVFFKDHF